MKMILAGPGTGKTTKVKTIIKDSYADAEDILVLSFTNVTVIDLTESFTGSSNIRCYTLHSYALIINHLINHHILDDNHEPPILLRFSESNEIEFGRLCDFYRCITFDGMIKSCLEFLKAHPIYGEEKVLLSILGTD